MMKITMIRPRRLLGIALLIAGVFVIALMIGVGIADRKGLFDGTAVGTEDGVALQPEGGALLSLVRQANAIAISALTAITGANTASGDHFVIVDISEAAAADRTKRITRDELILAISGNLPANSVSDEELDEGAAFDWTGTQTFDSLMDIGTVETFTDTDQTPDVSTGIYWNSFTNTLTITDFDGTPIDGQLLYVNSKAAITFDCTASGLLCGSTDIVTASGDATVWLFTGTDWDLLSFKDQSADAAGGGGGGEDAFTAESTPDTNPTATGVDAIGIGDGAIAGNASADNATVAIGASASAIGIEAVAIGQFTDASGDNSVAIGGDNNDSLSADATGNNSIAIGRRTNASANNSIAIGDNAQSTTNTESIAFGTDTLATGIAGVAIGDNADATGANCIAIGGNAQDSDSANCTAADAVAIGQHITADDIGEFGFASGDFVTASDAHTSIFNLRNITTDATQTELFSDGSAGDISVPSDCTLAFNVLITARQTDADDVSAGYSFFGVIDNNAGTTALVGSLSAVTTIGEDVAGWDVTATADDTNDGINILVTGAVGDAVRWVARVEIVEVCG